MATLLALLLLALAIGFWLDSLRVRESACAIGRATCERLDLQFLDDTVALQRLRTARNQAGKLRLLRTYQFDYTATGAQRATGIISLLDTEVVRIIVGNDILNY
ncbi:MAG: DUF3301 domain-containing protein [Gammaproteobacteria bacterium]